MQSQTTANKKGNQSVIWWIGWILLTIGSFFVAAFFWTPIIASRVGSIRDTKASVLWVVAVFGSWMIALIPLIIFMYRKVDKAYEDARIRREKMANRFQSILVEKSKRELPPEIYSKLKRHPETIPGGHLVNAVLKDGRLVSNVFVAGGEILGIYNAKELSFEGKDVIEIEPSDLSNTSFLAANWLRLDGVLPPD